MKLSKIFIPTLKETPAEATIPSHILMIRAGMIRPLASGIYSFLPLGYHILRKITDIVRYEMNKIGAQEFHLPALNPRELWEETDRVEAFGDTMFHIKNRELVLAPTHEEIIAHIASGHLKSYKDLPQIWYQIQTKFRNEARPRSGVIRGRQFLMKDSYSLDATLEGLDDAYNLHAEAYKKIFDSVGLKYFIVGASSGAMGGSASQEFMVESDAGEDTCAVCDNCGYAANVEVAQAKYNVIERESVSEEIRRIHTPNVKSIDELSEFLKIPTDKCAKSRVYIHDDEPVLVLMKGNDEVNESKLLSILGGKIRPAYNEELTKFTGADAGSIGPINIKMKIIADVKLQNANNMFSGANENDYHLGGIDFQRDFTCEYRDLHFVESGSNCIHCDNKLRVVKAIELGHIFKLGTKYSVSLNAYFNDIDGTQKPIIMGSYGIGIERIMACLIEQNHDKDGIIWPKEIAPYRVHLIALNLKNPEVKSVAEQVYFDLIDKDIPVLYDDRIDVMAGFKFKDADLLGMPYQIIVGEKNLQKHQVEIKERKTGIRKLIDVGKVSEEVRF